MELSKSNYSRVDLRTEGSWLKFSVGPTIIFALSSPPLCYRSLIFRAGNLRKIYPPIFPRLCWFGPVEAGDLGFRRFLILLVSPAHNIVIAVLCVKQWD